MMVTTVGGCTAPRIYCWTVQSLHQEQLRRELRISRGVTWKSHLYQLEAEGKDGLAVGQVKYVLYEDSGGSWRVQCVPVDEASFQSRHPLPEKFRGVRDDALSALWGIPGCIFVHASGFIGGNKTYEGALEMARRSLAAGAGGSS